MEKGIYKPEAVFGNFLVNLCNTSSGIPEFLERCVAKMETMMETVGIYRINGDAALVQKLRFTIFDKYIWDFITQRYTLMLQASLFALNICGQGREQ